MEQQNLRPDGGCQPQSRIPNSTNSLKVSLQGHSSFEETQFFSNIDVEEAVQEFSSENGLSTRLPLQSVVVQALVAEQVECLILDTTQVLEGKLTMPSKLGSFLHQLMESAIKLLAPQRSALRRSTGENFI